MTLRLILIRHAKSSWDNPRLDDHARPLNKRGQRAAVAIGRWLAERQETPEVVLSSDAVRTRETLERLVLPLTQEPRVVWLHDLYLAGPGTMLKALHGAGQAASVLMLGHNPGIGQFAAAMLKAPPEHPRFDAYPTGAALIADYDVDKWQQTRPGTGACVAFTVPRDLTD